MSETGSDFDNLPSKANYYNKFENSQEVCTGKCETEIVKYSLTTRGLEKHEGQIKNALAYLHKIYGDGKTPSKSEACHFLYYWIGEKLFGSTAQSPLTKTYVYSICGHINNYCTEEGNNSLVCGLPCNGQSDINQETFNDMKKVFDFWYDYGAIRTLLEYSGSEGIEKCKSYWQNVKAAHNKVVEHCGSHTDHDYCKNFWKPREDQIQQQLTEFQSELASAQDRKKREAQLASLAKEEAVRSATTTSSISSIIGTLAATAFPFLLYKYKLLPSWFGNNSNGRSRKKRSTARNRDTLTEDSSTFDSTDTSTIGPTDLAENSTVRSGVYTTPSTRQSTMNRETNNAPARQNIGYQNI
ncbi:KIR protein [Plasmodium coatneyi]|uniref:KIR protein n=1 Tax=Plasmodium coatneyi TaxID=208452 RepID=A0A1B1E7G6_9APIC|nr:KIR protein [Plasmodium coatneyi]ANQ10966.1 KIR protein [Plasmodium coatneyi]